MRRLVHHLDAGPICLDPAHCIDYAGDLVLAAVLEPLFFQVAPGRFRLGAAASWRQTTDGLVHSFTLRHDARWSHGEPVIADDFVAAFSRILDPIRASPAAGILSPVLEAEAVSVDTLQLVLRHPVDDLPARLAATATSPVPASVGTGDWHPGPCNGPFCIEYLGKARIDLRPNLYARPQLQAEAFMSICISRELHQPLVDFERGLVDITCSTWFPFERLEQFTHRPELRTAPSPIRFLVCGNEDRLPAWGQVKIRTALSVGVARKAVAEKLAGGIVPWQVATCESPSMELSHSQATSSSTRCSLLTPDFYPNRHVAEEISRSWSRTGLVDARIEAVDFSTFAERWACRDFDLCLALVAPPYPSPDALAPALAVLAPLDVRTRALELSAAVESTVGAARTAAKIALETFYERAMPFIPLFASRSIWLQRTNVNGYAVFPDGGHSFRGVGFEGG